MPEPAKLLRAAKVRQINHERAKRNVAANLLDELHAGDRRPASGDQVVDKENALTRLNRIFMKFDLVLAILKGIALPDRPVRQLAFLPHGDETDGKLMRNGAAENEPTRLDADDLVDLISGERLHHFIDDAAKRARVRQERRYVPEHDARLRIVGNGADGAFEVHEDFLFAAPRKNGRNALRRQADVGWVARSPAGRDAGATARMSLRRDPVAANGELPRRMPGVSVTFRAFIATAAALLAAACDGAPVDAAKRFFAHDRTREEAAADAGRAPAPGIDLAALSDDVEPGEDFYRYANGAAASGASPFVEAELAAAARVRALMTSVVETDDEADPSLLAAAALLQTHVDLATIDAAGFAPIREDVEAIAALQSHEDIARAFADPGLSPMAPIAIYVRPIEPGGRALAHLAQWGLGLGAPSRYLAPRYDADRRAYRRLIEEFFLLIGTDTPAALADLVLDLETAIADTHWNEAKAQNPNLVDRAIVTSALTDEAPGFPWTDYLEAAGLEDEEALILREDGAIAAIAAIFGETPVDAWRAYLTFHLLNENAAVLPAPARALQGSPGDAPTTDARWRDGLNLYRAALSEPVMQAIRNAVTDEETVRAATSLAWDVRAAAEARFRSSETLSRQAQEEAARKLAGMTIKIGAAAPASNPTAPFEPQLGAAYENARAFRRWTWRRARDLLKEAAPAELAGHAAAFDALAYYDPLANEMTVSEGLLQPPFFDPAADPAANYGALGAIIGHEVSHAFDWEGRKIDAEGRRRTWWTAEDEARRTEARERLAAQLAAEGVYPKAVDQAAADLAGLQLAHDAYVAHLAGAAAPAIAGLSGDQRFFVAWAQIWRQPAPGAAPSPTRPPAAVRANLTVRNLEPWARAFDIDDGAPMALAPVEQVKFWR